MVEGYKSFTCSESDCNQSFACEDHLFVHGITSHSQLSLTAVGDQTPTPTKFFKTFEELGLFQELSRNPFDEDFKKAADRNSAEVAVVSVDDEVENLPSYDISTNAVAVTPQDDSAEVSRYVSETSLKTVSLPPPDLSTFTNSANSGGGLVVDIGGAAIGQLVIPLLITLPDGQSYTVNVPANVTIPNVPTILSMSSVVASRSSTQTESEVALNAVQIASPPVVVESSSSYSAAGTASSTITTARTRESKRHTTAAPAIAASTREKLKAAMQQRASGVPSSEKMRVVKILPQVHPPVGKLLLPPRSQCMQALTTTNAVSTHDVATNAVASTVVRLQAADTSTSWCNASNQLAYSYDVERSDRRKFLERQKAAANRCRLKKKQWLSSLEVRTQKMEAHNQRLQNEARNLKIEMSQIKEFLLEHRSCPTMTVDALEYLVSL